MTKATKEIFIIGGNLYTFDSTTIDLCRIILWWAKFPEKKGGIKVHTLKMRKHKIPAFFHITESAVNDSREMKETAC